MPLGVGVGTRRRHRGSALSCSGRCALVAPVTVVVLLGLAVMWASLLVPGWIRASRERSGRQNSMDAFHQQLSVFERWSPSRPAAGPPGARLRSSDRFSDHGPSNRAVPSSATAAAQRRRDFVVLLAVAAAGSLVGGLVSGSVLVLTAHLGIDLLLVVYCRLIIRRRRIEAGRLAEVHLLPGLTGEQTDPSALRRRPAT